MYILRLITKFAFFPWYCAQAFCVPHTFSGNLGPYELKHVEKPVASHFFKHQQIKTITEEHDLLKANEFGEAKHWCRTHTNDENYFVTAICCDEFAEYLVLHRYNVKRIITVEAVVRNLDADSLTVDQLILMLRKQSTGKYFQMQDLKRWANGRYQVESRVENMFDIS